MTFSCNINEYRFRVELEELLGVELNELHNWLGEFNEFEGKNDQQTIIQRVF